MLLLLWLQSMDFAKRAHGFHVVHCVSPLAALACCTGNTHCKLKTSFRLLASCSFAATRVLLYPKTSGNRHCTTEGTFLHIELQLSMGFSQLFFFSIMKPFMIKNILVFQWLILRPFIIRAWACNNKQERFNCICIWICARRLNFAALVVVVWPANKEKSSLESDWESKRACFFYGIFYGSPLCREKICKNSSLWIKIQCKISLRQILSRKRIIFSTTSFHLNV